MRWFLLNFIYLSVSFYLISNPSIIFNLANEIIYNLINKFQVYQLFFTFYLFFKVILFHPVCSNVQLIYL